MFLSFPNFLLKLQKGLGKRVGGVIRLAAKYVIENNFKNIPT